MAILLIILKILLIILLAVLGIVLLVLIVPVGADVSYIDGKLTYKVKFWFLNVMDSEGGGLLRRLKNRKKKPKKPKKPKPAKEKKQKKKKKASVDDDFYLEDFDFDADEAEITALPADEAEEIEIPSVEAEEVHEEQEKPKEKNNPENTETVLYEDEKEETESGNKRSISDLAEKAIEIWESADRPLLKIFKGFHFSDLYIDFLTADEDAHKCALKYGKYSGMTYSIIAFMSELFTVRLKTVDVRCGFGLSKGKWDISCSMFFRAGTAVIAGLWFLITYMTRTFIPNKIRKIKRKKSAARQK